MAGLKFLYLCIAVSLTITSKCVEASPPTVKGAYWPSWAMNFPPSAIDTTLFTHIFYAFLLPNSVTFKFEVSNSTAVQLTNFTTTLRHKTPPPKTLFSIGGGGVDSNPFARMASDSSSRQVFINSTIELARKFGFDGVDLDWEFPENQKEMQDFALLLDDWRVAINKEAKITNRPPLLLTAAVYFAVDFFIAAVYRSYPAGAINKNLDWINAMCYDYHGSWDTSATGAHAALFDPKSNISSSYGLNSWIMAGLSPDKVVMGLPLYGKSWELKDPNKNWVGAPAVGLGPGDEGIVLYKEVEEFNKKNRVRVVYDMRTISTYSYVGSSWIGYDDAVSTTVKIGYAQALGLRGYFFWALSFDSNWKISKQASRAWIVED